MSQNSNNTEQTVEKGPHIPGFQWEEIYWPITNTTITTFLFLILVVVFSLKAKSALWKKESRLKVCLLDWIWYIDNHLKTSFWDKDFARWFLPLILWIFSIIFFGNLFWLVIDWLWASVSPTILHYFRPINSDVNTTLVLWLITVFSFIWISIKYRWLFHTAQWYLFNFTWHSFVEKIINVFVWWLHLIWIPSTLASLSLRLFWNIFAWIVLIWVITFLLSSMTQNLFEIWRYFSIPFWFFELFVSFIQAMVFWWLMIAYFGQNKEEHH